MTIQKIVELRSCIIEDVNGKWQIQLYDRILVEGFWNANRQITETKWANIHRIFKNTGI